MIYETPVLETERLILKRGTLKDLQKIYEWDLTKLRNVGGEFEWVKLDPRVIEGMEEPSENSYAWVAYLKEDMAPISNIVADRERKDINSIELAFNTHPDYWRKGYTKEALEEIISFLFDQGYDNIICGYEDGNFRSKSIGEKLGFIPYEVLENAWQKKGVWITNYVSILSKEKYKNDINKKLIYQIGEFYGKKNE